jgi:hypothetical protein
MIYPALASNDPDLVHILDVCVLIAFSDSHPTHDHVLNHEDPRTDHSLKLKRAESLPFIPTRSIQSPIAR